MKAHTLFKELSKESFWAGQSDKVRWIAARYYAGIEDFADLCARGRVRPVFRDATQPPELTEAQIRMILQLR